MEKALRIRWSPVSSTLQHWGGKTCLETGRNQWESQGQGGAVCPFQSFQGETIKQRKDRDTEQNMHRGREKTSVNDLQWWCVNMWGLKKAEWRRYTQRTTVYQLRKLSYTL